MPLTPRAAKLRRDGLAEVLRRRFNPDAQPRFRRRRRDPPRRWPTAPIVAVAVDLSEQPPALAEALRAAVSRILATLPGARVACLNVLRTNRVMLDTHARRRRPQQARAAAGGAAPLGGSRCDCRKAAPPSTCWKP